ncbi:DNRLRE domain-containing protein, partial [candidate division KSB1 bacterium]|nr:DNRLRE domain-containing protein [candidate division KSB1 bacterium]
DPALVPTLELIYSFRDSTGIKRDTTKVYSKLDAFLVLNSETNLNLDNDFFYIGKGIAFRSFIKFDLEGLDSTIHVNRALLKIVVNKQNSIRDAFDAYDCRIFRMEGASWIKGEVNEEPATGTYSGTQSDSTLTFDLSPSLHGMLGKKYPNYGFLVRSNDESATISRVAFYSSKAEIELQPRLVLYYTLPPKQEF